MTQTQSPMSASDVVKRKSGSAGNALMLLNRTDPIRSDGQR